MSWSGETPSEPDVAVANAGGALLATPKSCEQPFFNLSRLFAGRRNPARTEPRPTRSLALLRLFPYRLFPSS
jgi:hypothetical protein